MRNLIKIGILTLSLALILTGIAFAQETTPQDVNLDEEVKASDLGISEPKILPDSPFYFLKNWIRSIRSFFAFNPIAKARLRERFANEKLMELKKMIELKKSPEAIKKATENYQNEIERIKKVVEKIREKARENPKVESFLDKFIHQQTLHQKLLERLEKQVPPQAFEKIKKARERHLERFKDVMLKLEDRKEKLTEKLEKILEKQKGSEFKEFKSLEILKELEEIVPEKAKEAIQKARDKIMENLENKLEKMPPEKQERFKEYVEKISGDKTRQLEILEDLKARIQSLPVKPELKEKLEKAKEKILKKIEKRAKKFNCPQWTPPAPGFCKEGRIIVMRDPKTGCPLPPKCIVPGEIGIPNPASAYCKKLGYKHEIRTRADGTQFGVCIFPDKTECEEWSFYRGECGQEWRKKIPEKPKFCIMIWDPVCGVDGKTYSNECFAKLAGVEIAHKGICKEEKPKPPEKPVPLPETLKK